jgi:hypothetical protein
MSDVKLRYVLSSAKYANADNLTANIKMNLPLTNQLLPESDIIELVSLVQRYDRERQSSSTHRIYGRLGFITTNELSEYNQDTITLINPSTQVPNYNLQLTYPSSHTNDVSLKDFSCDIFPLLCGDYSGLFECDFHKIYHGLPFIDSTSILYNGKSNVSIKTYNHKFGNNISAEDYVYVIPAKFGTTNSLYGIFKVNSTVLDDGTQNVLILDKSTTGENVGSYKKIINPSENDINFLNTINCELYVTSTTVNELFIRTSEQHNVIVGDFIDVRQSGGTVFNQFNGIHKVSRIITNFI